MEVFKVLISHGDKEQRICDAIEHESKLWLVTHWLDVPARGLSKPGRLVRFDNLPHRPAHPTLEPGAKWVLTVPLPIRLFDFETPKPPLTGFEILEMPDVTPGAPQPRRLN
jgi:hypothetical protein